jgi:hypothetical protein
MLSTIKTLGKNIIKLKVNYINHKLNKNKNKIALNFNRK